MCLGGRAHRCLPRVHLALTEAWPSPRSTFWPETVRSWVTDGAGTLGWLSPTKAPCIHRRSDLERGLQPRPAGTRHVCVPVSPASQEASRGGRLPLPPQCPLPQTGHRGREQSPSTHADCRLGKGLRVFPPGPAQPLPTEAMASAASGLRDYLKSWRAEPWLLHCQDMVVCRVPLLGRQSSPDGRVSSGGAWGVVLGSPGGGQVESAISHVCSGDPSPGAPQASVPAPPAVHPGLSRGTLGPHPRQAHEAPRKLLPVAAGQQGHWACGQALGEQEPLAHGHIGGWHPRLFPGRRPSSPSTAGLQALL